MAYTVYDTQGVITDSWPYKESSRRLSIYSRDIGRMLVRAQAVRKVDSKLQPATQLYTESQFELVYGQAGWRLVGAAPIRNFFLAANPGSRSAIIRVSQLLTRLIPGRKSDQQLYATVRKGLRALSSKDNTGLIEKLLVFRLVARLGYAPDPTAQQLQPFVETGSYEEPVLSAFSEEKAAATSQINRALANTQL